MCVDPSGHSVLLTSLLLTGGLTLAGGIIGGISAGMTGDDVFAGIFQGMVNGFSIGASLSLIACGIYIGAKTVLGCMLSSYGISILSNFVEVGITQGMKSAGEGLDFVNIMNNINKANFSNTGAILMGRFPFIPIDVYGSRLATKWMFLINAFVNSDIDKILGFSGVPYSLYVGSALFSTASIFSLLLSYGIAGISVICSIIRICMQDYNNSPWKLY